MKFYYIIEAETGEVVYEMPQLEYDILIDYIRERDQASDYIPED